MTLDERKGLVCKEARGMCTACYRVAQRAERPSEKSDWRVKDWKRYQEADEMRRELGLQVPEIAQRLGVKDETVEKYLAKAKKEREAA